MNVLVRVSGDGSFKNSTSLVHPEWPQLIIEKNRPNKLQLLGSDGPSYNLIDLGMGTQMYEALCSCSHRKTFKASGPISKLPTVCSDTAAQRGNSWKTFALFQNNAKNSELATGCRRSLC